MKVTQEQIDKLIYRHAIEQRFALGFSEDMARRVARYNARIIEAWRDFEDVASDKDFDALLVRNTRNKAVKSLLDGIADIYSEMSDTVTSYALKTLSDFTEKDLAAKTKILGSEAKLNPFSILAMPISGRPPAIAWNELFTAWKNATISEIIAAVQNDVDVPKAIRGTPEQNRKDSIFNSRQNAISALASTQITGVSQNASNAIFYAEDIGQELYLATLDYRACTVCGALDGNVYDGGKGKFPPIHPRCRCVRVPYVEGMPDAQRPYVKDKRRVKDIPKGERTGKIGSTRFRYDEWFERLPEGAKREILGASRYELWKKGDVELIDFVAVDSGKIITLDDLEDKFGKW